MAAAHHDEDARLVRRCQAGDEGAFEELYRRHAPAVARYARGLVRDPDLAADVTQDAFAYFFRKIPEYRFDAPLRHLLFTAARHLGLNLLEKRRRREAAPIEELAVPGDEPDPARTAEDRDLARRALEGLGRLPPLYREALTLRLLEGWSYQDIARVAGCPVGTVKSRVHNGIELLRKSVRMP